MTETRRLRQAPAPAVGWRLLPARVFATVGALLWGWLFYGLQDTMTVFIEGQDFASHYVLESGWGLLFLVLVAIPLVGLAFQPRLPLLVAQVAAVGVAVMVAALLAGSAAHLLPGAGVLLTAFALAGCARMNPHSLRMDINRPLAACVLLAALPAFGYAWRMATSTQDVEVTVGLDHYPIQAAVAVAVVILAGLISVAGDAPGARLATATVAFTVAWLGLESAIYPHLIGSLGTAWGWIAVGWAVTFLALGLRRREEIAADPVEDPSP